MVTRRFGTSLACVAALGTLETGEHGWQGRLARRLLQAAAERTTSLGAHYRSDGGWRG